MRERSHSEDGLTLIEVLVVLILTSIVSTTAFAVLNSVVHAEKYTDEYARVVDDGRVSIDRIRRELREGRRVYASSDPHHLHWWADRNQDGLQQADEKINYCVAPMSSNTCVTSSMTGQFRLIRWSDAEIVADAKTIAATLTGTDVFSGYAADVTATRVIDMDFSLDVQDNGRGPETVFMTASVRLRNVA